MATRRRKEVIPVYFRETADPKMYSENQEKLERYMTTSNLNRLPPNKRTRKNESRVREVFEQAFLNILRHSPFEADEVSIYRYGLVIRPDRALQWSKQLEATIRDALEEYPNSSIHVVEEEDTFAIRINLGSYLEVTPVDDIGEDLEEHEDLLSDIVHYIEQEYGLTGWFVFWDTDEELYQ